MAIERWDPWENLATLQDRINRLFSDSLPGRSREAENEISMSAWRPAVDIFDTGDAIVLNAELPGVSKEDVSIEIKDNILTLKGEKNFNKEIKKENFYRREINRGKFHRAFTLLSRIDPDKIQARFNNGILEVKIPKPDEEKPKQVTIKVE